jgi:lipoprotein-releasing system ATP-binding protein
VLAVVGLDLAIGKHPGELSGGMQQRVAIARAGMQPPVVLADEPAGNLGTAASNEAFALMRSMHAELNTSFVMVTHNQRLVARCDRVIEMVDGRIERDATPG